MAEARNFNQTELKHIIENLVKQFTNKATIVPYVSLSGEELIKGKEGDAGYNLQIIDDVEIVGDLPALIPTGIHLFPPKTMNSWEYFDIRYRGSNNNFVLLAGLVDVNYIGHIFVKVKRSNGDPKAVFKGEKPRFQLVPSSNVEFVKLNYLTEEEYNKLEDDDKKEYVKVESYKTNIYINSVVHSNCYGTRGTQCLGSQDRTETV